MISTIRLAFAAISTTYEILLPLAFTRLHHVSAFWCYICITCERKRMGEVIANIFFEIIIEISSNILGESNLKNEDNKLIICLEIFLFRQFCVVLITIWKIPSKS